MKALKYQVRIGPDHKVTIEVPPETPPGEAEVIVLVPDQAGKQETLAELLKEFQANPVGRSKEDIDAYLAGERESWD